MYTTDAFTPSRPFSAPASHPARQIITKEQVNPRQDKQVLRGEAAARCAHENSVTTSRWEAEGEHEAGFYIAPIPYHTDFPGGEFLVRQISYETDNVAGKLWPIFCGE